MSTIIRVTGEHPSTITVGHGLGFKPIREALDEAATKVLIVHARPLASRAKALAQYLREQGIDASTADHPDAEAGKSIEVVASLWDECGRLQVGRKDAIVAMGGGATTDMAGFVAATWLRGITLINVPTTLLAMVDAAVGGKTGINTSVGKNLVGSFYPATSVVADMDLLESLPTPDLAAGVAEVIKCGFIADPEILRIVEETEPGELLRSNSPQHPRDRREGSRRVGRPHGGRPARNPQLRTHAGTRDRAREQLHLAARRCCGRRMLLRSTTCSGQGTAQC